MNIAIIKRMNEIMPDWIKCLFARRIRHQLISNEVFLDQYKQLLKYDSMTETEKKELQFKLLKNSLVHAYEHTKYYHELFDRCHFNAGDMECIQDICTLPTMDKKILELHFEELKADDSHDYYDVSTGGTTGKPTHIQMDRNAIFREWAFVYHYWSKYGYDYKKSRLVTLRGVDFKGKPYKINPLYGEIRFNLAAINESNIDYYIRKIRCYKGDFLYGYPSAIYNLCRIIKKNNIDIKGQFKAVFLISENLYPFQEEMIKTVLGAPIAIFYGHSERAVFAEHDMEGYSFHPCYGYTELDEEGHLMVTGFINSRTPLIRYKVDDEVKKNKTGKYDICGHRDGILYGKDGEQVSMAFVNFHSDVFAKIKNYQFVQDEIGKCVLHVVSTQEDFSAADLVYIEKKVNQKLGVGYQCKVKQVSDIALTARGKYRMVIQNCKIENR